MSDEVVKLDLQSPIELGPQIITSVTLTNREWKGRDLVTLAKAGETEAEQLLATIQIHSGLVPQAVQGMGFNDIMRCGDVFKAWAEGDEEERGAEG